MSRKDDKGKIRFSLIPWKSLREVVKIFEHGATKYGDDNWKTVPQPKTRYMNALLRHATATMEGERTDEDGLDHLACIAANALILLWFRLSEERLTYGRATITLQAAGPINFGDLVFMMYRDNPEGKEYSDAPCAD